MFWKREHAVIICTRYVFEPYLDNFKMAVVEVEVQFTINIGWYQTTICSNEHMISHKRKLRSAYG